MLVDDHVIPAEGRRRPGRPKKLTDAELVCLAVAQVLLGARSEHHWMRTCYARLWHLFPYLPNQPGYHKRVKAAAPLICREVAQELLAHARDRAALRDGMIVLTDKGLSGKEMEHFAAEQVGVLLIRPDRKDEKRWIESVNDTLNGQLDLEQHGGRTGAGVYARVAQRLLALAAAIWHNWATDAPIRLCLSLCISILIRYMRQSGRS